MVVCPSCGSSRIRNDYKPAPVLLRVVGIRALLCDHCNHQFRAFSPRAPRHGRPSGASRKADVFNPAPEVDLSKLKVKPAEERKPEEKKKDPPRKISLKNLNLVISHHPPVNGELVHSRPRDLRTRVTTLYEQKIRQVEALKSSSGISSLTAGSLDDMAICPECGSRDAKRRPRKALERVVLSITDQKPYNCLDCGASFYTRPEKGEAGAGMVNSVS
ncbi:MAG: hypothetical protein IPM66_13560 [Acidobacteriota bacterium]|nr:MAG: hypothetical protein IPM66_13560 [Acidobacteriota bacterium]